MEESTDKVKEAYWKACIDGSFYRDSQYPYTYGLERSKVLEHAVVFLAYDGIHLGHYTKTKEEADCMVLELNALHSVELVDAYFERIRSARQ